MRALFDDVAFLHHKDQVSVFNGRKPMSDHEAGSVLCQRIHMICANEELLKQVWINLLDNAIKFSDPNGTVSVDISDGSECLSISVSNHGKDIPKDRIAHIFNKFYQADESHSSEGTGIGLAVVKKVCELHGGAVSAKSESGTTTFTVVLPKQQNM